jgi:hypothetical protein
VQTLKDAIVVPQASIVQGARGRVVFVVEQGNKVAARPIEVVYAAGPDAVVTGVRPGDRVVLDGRQNVRPGATVVERAADDAAAASGTRGRRGAASEPGGRASGAASGAGRGKPASGVSAHVNGESARAAMADAAQGST